MTKPKPTSKPTLTIETLSSMSDEESDAALRDELHRDMTVLAEESLEEDPESEFGLMMYEVAKNTKGPNVQKTARRGSVYEGRAKRIKRLASLMLELTPFQNRFVHIYCQFNWDSHSDIAIAAGSTAKPGQNARNIAYQTLKNKKVIEAIGLMNWSKLEAEGIDKHEVVASFRDIRDCAIADGDYREANAANEKLGSIIGLFSLKGNKALMKEMTRTEQDQLTELGTIGKTTTGGAKASVPYDMAPSDKVQMEEDLKEQLRIATQKARVN